MKKKAKRTLGYLMFGLSAVALSMFVALGTSTAVSADEADAKRLLKGMSDYLSAQKSLSFEYDATLEVVTKDEQKLALASSGTAVLNRPDKLRATRTGGFVDVELLFDGKMLTILGNKINRYAQVELTGTVDQLIDDLREKYHRPLPAADLMLSAPYDTLMANVVDVKDLGSGVIAGKECDHLAFRTDEVDWQIWIAHGEKPYPCRFTITSKLVAGGPQYNIQIRDWKDGEEVAATDFSFNNSMNAEQIELKDLGTTDLPAHFMIGDTE
ncbi:MAG: DUF2092 domain-containing protein [Candidatus Competibacteraceae bacterium]|jgi:hypothetical protein|nr:DUF2092 domain-containing protein [Candidatus Competibacteraceae bacterium]